MKLEVCLRVALTKLITGEQIRDAVNRLAGREARVELVRVTDQGRFYKIGRSSEDPSKDLSLGIGDGHDSAILLEETYDAIYVLADEYPGMKYAVRVQPESIEREVRRFRDALQAELAKE